MRHLNPFWIFSTPEQASDTLASSEYASTFRARVSFHEDKLDGTGTSQRRFPSPVERSTRVSESAFQQGSTPSSVTSSSAAGQRWRVRFEAIVGVLALIPIVLFLIASLGRLRYPFPLEQLEGPMLLAAERVAHGLPVYVRPNFHFIPYMYAPAYYYVTGWAVRLLGPSFLPLRLISLLSTCGSLAIIYIFVFLDTGGARKRRHLAALSGASLYAVAYPWTREWFDLGRLDSLYILLLLLALLCTRLSGKRLHPAFAAMVWTLAFLAKQTIFPVALIMLCWDWKRPRRLLFGVGSFLLMAGVSTTLLNRATDGWFWFYAFAVPGANADLLLRPIVFYVPAQLIAPFGVALLVIAAGILTHVSEARHGAPALMLRFYLLAAISTFFLCWFLQAHAGATSNTSMPVYAVLAIVFGISFGRIDASLALENCREPARVLLLAAVCIPLISWVYNPHDIVPHRDLAASQEELVSWLRIFPGDVFLPANPYEAVVGGKPWHPDIAALHDSLRPSNPQIRQSLLDEIHAEIDGEKFDAIAFDALPEQTLADQTWLPRDLESHYPVLGIVPGSNVWDPFSPHPVYFLLPCREQALAVTRGWTLLRTGSQLSCPH